MIITTVASNLPGAEPEFPLVRAEECRPRAGLPNFLKKASQKGAEVRIGYFGGSITAQPGWRVLGLMESPLTGADGNVEYLIAGEKTMV